MWESPALLHSVCRSAVSQRSRVFSNISYGWWESLVEMLIGWNLFPSIKYLWVLERKWLFEWASIVKSQIQITVMYELGYRLWNMSSAIIFRLKVDWNIIAATEWWWLIAPKMGRFPNPLLLCSNSPLGNLCSGCMLGVPACTHAHAFHLLEWLAPSLSNVFLLHIAVLVVFRWGQHFLKGLKRDFHS